MLKRISPIGDCGIRICFGDEVSPQLSQKIIVCKKSIESKKFPWITDMIPSFTTLTIFYRPFKITYKEICDIIVDILNEGKELNVTKSIVYHIPTCYESPFQIDLEEVARMNDLTVEDVISIHSNQLYYIYFLGFLPGFAYLGGMDARISAPRLDAPRLHVPAGSVAIAGEQTGIYPINSPGGWRIIGRTPLRLYDLNNVSPILLKPGNYVRFYSVSYDEYKKIEQQVKKGTFQMKKTTYKGETNVAN